MAQHQFYGPCPMPRLQLELVWGCRRVEIPWQQLIGVSCAFPTLLVRAGGRFLISASRQQCCPRAARRAQQKGVEELLKNTTVSLGTWKAQTLAPECPLEHSEGKRGTRAVYENWKRTKCCHWAGCSFRRYHGRQLSLNCHERMLPSWGKWAQHKWPEWGWGVGGNSCQELESLTRRPKHPWQRNSHGLLRAGSQEKPHREKNPHVGICQAEGAHTWLQQF